MLQQTLPRRRTRIGPFLSVFVGGFLLAQAIDLFPDLSVFPPLEILLGPFTWLLLEPSGGWMIFAPACFLLWLPAMLSRSRIVFVTSLACGSAAWLFAGLLGITAQF